MPHIKPKKPSKSLVGILTSNPVKPIAGALARIGKNLAAIEAKKKRR